MSDGHPVWGLDEPDAIVIDQLVIEARRSGGQCNIYVAGAISAHAIGRLGERTDCVPVDVPGLIGTVGFASLMLPLDRERAIALRVHERDDAFLIGTLRNSDGFFADWRTTMPRDWISSDLAHFGDMLADIVTAPGKILDGRKALPFVPARPDRARANINAEIGGAGEAAQ
jgi:hypothetical protein